VRTLVILSLSSRYPLVILNERRRREMVKESDPDGGILRIPGRSRCAVIGPLLY
jgi:hypothetical protein